MRLGRPDKLGIRPSRRAATAILAGMWLVSACLKHGEAATPKIYGGTPVAAGELPAVVALTLQLPGSSTPMLSCSGTLIAPDVVLTAGHCLKGPGFDATTLDDQLKDQLHVYVGDGAEGGALSGNTIVQAVAVHPMLRQHPIGYADYGLVFLSTKVEAVPPIPVVVDLAGSVSALRAATTTLVGFGERDDRGSGRKFQVDAKVTSFNSAEAVVGGGGKDSCGGDSGGPALIKATDGSWRLLGSVSRGLHLGCGDGGLISLVADGWCWVQQVATGHQIQPTTDCATWSSAGSLSQQPYADFNQLCQASGSSSTQQETIRAILLGLDVKTCALAAQKLQSSPHLNLDFLMLRDLTPLAQLHGVRHLSIKGNRISDLTPLRELTELQVLEIDGNQITTTAPLAALQQRGLQILGAHRQLTNFAATAFLRLCQDPKLPADALTTVRAIFFKTQSSDCATANERLLSMQTLTLNNRHLSDLTPLADLQQITALNLSGNDQLSDVSPLAGLERLETLDLTGTKVVDLSPLAALKFRGLIITGP